MRFSFVTGYLIALVGTAAAVLLRWVADPALQGLHPLITVYGAMAAVVYFAGARPAIVTAILGYLACVYLFMEPRGTFIHPQVALSLGLFSLTSALIIGTGGALRRVRRRADEGRELLRVTFASIERERQDLNRRLEAQVAERTAELRSSEERFRLLIEGTRDVAIFMLDPSGRIVSWNPGAERIKQYRASEIIGRHFSIFYPAEDIESGKPERELEIATREGMYEEEGWRLRKDGTRFWASVILTALWSEPGTLRGFSKVTRDSTERKIAEESARQLFQEETARRSAEHYAREMKEADRRKDEFLATLAHELRNPLAPIRNAVEILKDSNRDLDLRWGREVIDRQVHHMTRLLEDLFDISRISHNKLELRQERVALADVVQSAVETSRPIIDLGEHRFTLELPAEPIHIDADPVRLAQVFSNLLNNAAKYTERGGHIRFSAMRTGHEVTLSVKDDGIGIAPHSLPRVFEMFSQGQRLPDGSQGGLGLGLSLVRGLVELHGGHIEARSEGPGKGSEFLVRLPVPEQNGGPKSPANGTASKSILVKRRLLIVDDLRDSADSLALMLRMMGHEVHTAYDGEEGVAAAAKFKPEIALLDIGMPKLSGYEAARHIRREPWGKDMFLVALTGWGQEDDRNRTQEAGFNHHIVKPADPAEIMNLLERLPRDNREAVKHPA